MRITLTVELGGSGLSRGAEAVRIFTKLIEEQGNEMVPGRPKVIRATWEGKHTSDRPEAAE